MSTITRHSETCQIKASTSGRMTEAVVQSFDEHKMLTVIINKSVKLSMKWNGKVYEGKAAGIDFESVGPAITKTQSSSRG